MSGPNRNISNIDNTCDNIDNKLGRKGISFEPLSEVVLLRQDDPANTTPSTVSFNKGVRLTKPPPSPALGHSKNKSHKQNKSPKSDTFDIYCSNISSLSDHAIKHLFKECSKYHIWSLLETRLEKHRIDKYKSDFKNRARQFLATPADTTTSAASGGMAHGGELIAPMAHLNITCIDPAVYQYIESHTGAPLRICAAYVRLH